MVQFELLQNVVNISAITNSCSPYKPIKLHVDRVIDQGCKGKRQRPIN